MNSLLTKRFIQIAGILSLALLSPSHSLAGDLPKAIRSPHDGRRYPPACGEKEMRRLRDKVFKLIPSQNPQDAFDLARAMLCGDTKKDEDLVVQRMTNPLVRKSESTGEVGISIESLEPGASLLVRQQAWVNGDLVASEKADEIVISYASNEACSASFRLKITHGQWKIVELGVGCD